MTPRVDRQIEWWDFVAVTVGEKTVHSGLANLSTVTPQPTRRRLISALLSQPLPCPSLF